MTISPQNPVCPLADKGFLVTDAQTLPSLINAHPTVLVLLQSDPNKHPEVADSWVIIPDPQAISGDVLYRGICG